MSLTLEQKSTNYDTYKHIHRITQLLHKMAKLLLDRAIEHDQCKLSSPEVEIFSEFTDKLANSTYGSEEYENFRKQLGPALEHHYANSRHHPEHFANGVNDMDLIDILEMLCDWKASSERHNNGNINKSIEINAKRFNIDMQLTRILSNTIKYLDV